MKKLAIITTVFMFLPVIVLAQEISPTIRWVLDDTNNVKGFVVYYSNNDAMTNKQSCIVLNDPEATEVNIKSLDVDTFPVYFTIAAIQVDDREIESMPYAYSIAGDPGESTVVSAPQNLRILEN